ncbi:hypothetical protein [Rubrivivax sp. JA1026]|uniref:hypothetical protein n=1 Tax=Rubrivivax sp. JA1026 TaxID=2710888 RepID=UPI0013E973EF|nr:hypothetical protein [Rubrivivax sp. JA1026]
MTQLADLQARRAAYFDAELKALKAQETQVGQGGNARTVRRADLATIREAIADLDRQIAALQPGARRAYRIVPGCR